MIKQLTFEGRFECGFDDAVRGKVAALTAVIFPKDAPFSVSGCSYGLGIAIANEAGYIPVPAFWCHGDSLDEMQAHARELNFELFDLDAKAAALVVCSAMRGTPRRRRRVA